MRRHARRPRGFWQSGPVLAILRRVEAGRLSWERAAILVTALTPGKRFVPPSRIRWRARRLINRAHRLQRQQRYKRGA